MAYTYADWDTQATLALKLSRLRLHMQEVAQLIGQELGADGKNRGSFAVRQYYELLMREKQELEKRVERTTASDGASGMFSQVRLRDVDSDGRANRYSGY
jgi:hypothetical protein